MESLVGVVFDWVGGKVRGGEEGSNGKKHECVERWRLHLFRLLVSNVLMGCFGGFRVVMLSGHIFDLLSYLIMG